MQDEPGAVRRQHTTNSLSLEKVEDENVGQAFLACNAQHQSARNGDDWRASMKQRATGRRESCWCCQSVLAQASGKWRCRALRMLDHSKVAKHVDQIKVGRNHRNKGAVSNAGFQRGTPISQRLDRFTPRWCVLRVTGRNRLTSRLPKADHKNSPILMCLDRGRVRFFSLSAETLASWARCCVRRVPQVCRGTVKPCARVAHYRFVTRVKVDASAQTRIGNKLARPMPALSLGHFHHGRDETRGPLLVGPCSSCAPRTVTLADGVVAWRLALALPVLLVQELLLLTALEEDLKLRPLPELDALRDLVRSPNPSRDCSRKKLRSAFLPVRKHGDGVGSWSPRTPST